MSYDIDCLEGLERLHKGMTSYIKAISKRHEGDDKERNLPIAYMGGTMISHGEDFDMHSEFGQCLTCKNHHELFFPPLNYRF